jgi:hypothetical protein
MINEMTLQRLENVSAKIYDYLEAWDHE